jgi:hypothetical protein
MRYCIIGFGLGLILFIFGFVVVENVQATGCMVVPCAGNTSCNEETEACAPGWCTGDCGGIDNGGCGPNLHITPSGACLPNGSGGSGGGGVWEPNCIIQVWCPPGQQRGTLYPTTTEIYGTQLNDCRGEVGDAQVLGGILDNGGASGNPIYALHTYQCYPCAAGSTLQCVPAHSGSYSYVNVGWSGNPLDANYCQLATPLGNWYSYYRNSTCREVRIDHGGGEIEFSWECDYTVVCETYAQSCSCVNNCVATTAPSNVSIVAGTTPGTTANVTWSVGTGGGSQYFWVDENQYEVAAGCPTPGACNVSLQLTASDTSEIVTGLTPLTTYYFHIVTASSSGGSCPSESALVATPRQLPRGISRGRFIWIVQIHARLRHRGQVEG